MNTRRPLLGLLSFSFHSAKWSLALSLLASLAIGIFAIIREENALLFTFHYIAVGAAPYVVLMKSEGIAKWEQYQLAMPVKRKNLASILYLNVLITSLLIIPILGVVWGLGFIINPDTMPTIIQNGYIHIAFAFGFILLLTAILYPLGCSKLGEFSEQGLFFVGMAVSGVMLGAFFGIGIALGLTLHVIALLIIIIPGIAFIASLYITRWLYAKIDF